MGVQSKSQAAQASLYMPRNASQRATAAARRRKGQMPTITELVPRLAAFKKEGCLLILETDDTWRLYPLMAPTHNAQAIAKIGPFTNCTVAANELLEKLRADIATGGDE